jgi:hypothetical protein
MSCLWEQLNFFVIWWFKKIKSGVGSVKDPPHARRPKTASSPKMVEKVKKLIGTDARFRPRYKAKCVGISVGAAHTILRRRVFINEKDKCQMDTPSLYKRVKTCLLR